MLSFTPLAIVSLLAFVSLSAVITFPGPEIAEVLSTSSPHLVTGRGSGSFTCLSFEELVETLLKGGLLPFQSPFSVVMPVDLFFVCAWNSALQQSLLFLVLKFSSVHHQPAVCNGLNARL